MAHYVPVSRERHAGKRFVQSNRYHFAKATPVVALTAEELFFATKELTAAFIKSGERYVLVALLSLNQSQNLYVAPDGRWIGSYTPAMFRAYPFRLARISGEGGPAQVVLAVDEEDGLADDGELIFNEAGAMARPVAQFVEFLRKIEQDRVRMDLVVKSLEDAGLIEEWQLTLRAGEKEQRIKGLFRTSEKNLNEITDTTFLALRRSGGLALAYAQLLSMRNIDNLKKLADSHVEYAKVIARQQSDVFHTPNDGEIDIDWSQFSAENP